MVSFVLVDPGLQFCVACKAPGIGHFVAEVVALGAVRKTFEVGMNRCQRPGRDLRHTGRSLENGQKGYKDGGDSPHDVIIVSICASGAPRRISS